MSIYMGFLLMGISIGMLLDQFLDYLIRRLKRYADQLDALPGSAGRGN